MKKLIVFSLMILMLSSSELIGECNSDALSSNCIGQLAEGYNFLKTYKIDGLDGTKDRIEYSYVFMKGTQYMINICAEATNPDGIVVSLFDSKRNQVATNKVNNQLLPAIAYPCNASGIYYIQYSFDGSSTYCGGSALGFKR